MEHNVYGSQQEMSAEELTTAREQRRLELQKEFSYEGYLVIRKELYANLRDPAITVRNGNITFNTACIEELRDTVYVRPYFNEELGRFAIRRTTENDKSSLRWCISKGNKRKRRKINCKALTDVFYSTMKWDKLCRYKILGYLIKVDNEEIFVFDFTVKKVFHERPPKGEPGYNEPIDRKGFYPDDVLNTYGIPAEEYARQTEVFEEDGYINMAMLTGPRKSNRSMRVNEQPVGGQISLLDLTESEPHTGDTAEIGGDQDE